MLRILDSPSCIDKEACSSLIGKCKHILNDLDSLSKHPTRFYEDSERSQRLFGICNQLGEYFNSTRRFLDWD